MRTITLFSLLFVALISNAVAFVSPSLQTNDMSLHMTILTYGNKKKNFKPGTPLKTAVAQLGITPKYSCNKYVFFNDKMFATDTWVLHVFLLL